LRCASESFQKDGTLRFRYLAAATFALIQPNAFTCAVNGRLGSAHPRIAMDVALLWGPAAAAAWALAVFGLSRGAAL